MTSSASQTATRNSCPTTTMPTVDSPQRSFNLPDASVSIILFSSGPSGSRSETSYNVYRGLIERLSPSFFTSVVDSDPDSQNNLNREHNPRRYIVKKERGIAEDEFDVLASYLLHDMFVPLALASGFRQPIST